MEREGNDHYTISLSTGRGSVSIERIKKTQDCSLLLKTERRHVRLQDRPTDCTRIPFVDPNRIDKHKYFLMHAHDFAEPIGHAWTLISSASCGPRPPGVSWSGRDVVGSCAIRQSRCEPIAPLLPLLKNKGLSLSSFHRLHRIRARKQCVSAGGQAEAANRRNLENRSAKEPDQQCRHLLRPPSMGMSRSRHGTHARGPPYAPLLLPPMVLLPLLVELCKSIGVHTLLLMESWCPASLELSSCTYCPPNRQATSSCSELTDKVLT
mgnify:CR=1 FL=1